MLCGAQLHAQHEVQTALRTFSVLGLQLAGNSRASSKTIVVMTKDVTCKKTSKLLMSQEVILEMKFLGVMIMATRKVPLGL
jgi:hypothetical protein